MRRQSEPYPEQNPPKLVIVHEVVPCIDGEKDHHEHSASQYSSVLAFMLVVVLAGMTVGEDRPLEKDGRLVVIVTWGDVDNTPASKVFVEAHGYTHGLKSGSAPLVRRAVSHSIATFTSLLPKAHRSRASSSGHPSATAWIAGSLRLLNACS